MQIYYCEGCGKRISGEAAGAGGAGKAAPFCPECAAKNAHGSAAAVAKDSGAAPMLATAKPSDPSHPSSGTIRAARPSAIARQQKEGRAGARGAPGADEKKEPLPMLYLGIGGGVAVLVLIVFLFSSGKSSATTRKPDEVARAGAQPASPVTPTPTPVSEKTRPQPALVPSPTVPVPALPIPPVLPSKPVAAAQPPVQKTPDEAAKTAPADEAGWKTIFNGKDLAGWTVFKGSWKAEDGMLTNTPAPAARVDTNDSYTDFEMTWKMKLSTSRNGEIQIHSYGAIFPFSLPELDKWCDVHLTVTGNDAKCSIDGTALTCQVNGGGNKSGVFSMFVYGNAQIQMKDIKAREIKR